MASGSRESRTYSNYVTSNYTRENIYGFSWLRESGGELAPESTSLKRGWSSRSFQQRAVTAWFFSGSSWFHALAFTANSEGTLESQHMVEDSFPNLERGKKIFIEVSNSREDLGGNLATFSCAGHRKST